MGFKISWLAFENVEKGRLLEELGFRDTAIRDEANESPFSAAQLKNGWSIIWSNDFEWAETQPVKLSFPGGRAVSCQLHEGVMVSIAHGAQDGIERWSVSHDAQAGLMDLTIHGDTPAELAEVKSRLFAEQAQEDKTHAEVDLIFDIPIDLAEKITGFRHDLWEIDGERPAWTIIEAKA